MSDDASEVVWINLYRQLMGACGSVYTSRDLADQMAGRDRLACVAVNVRVGLGATLFNLARQWGQLE